MIPSPILIYGDPYIGKNNIAAIKRKFPDVKWNTRSLNKDSINEIRAEYGRFSFGDTEKILLLQDIPNRKQVREFVLDLISNPGVSKVIVWDSDGHIKNDPITKSMNKEWTNFIRSFRSVKGSKIIENADEFNPKDINSVIDFIVSKFGQYNKNIELKDAHLLLNIIGCHRGLLDSDIKKMAIVAPEKINSSFILEHSFSTSKESIIYKLGNVIDSGNYEESVNLMERFVSSGINENVIADILVKKARWQMVVASLWHRGMGWNDIAYKINEMGKFPSSIWHSNKYTNNQKRQITINISDFNSMQNHVRFKMGIPERYINRNSNVKIKKGESIPQLFMANMIVDIVKKIVSHNKMDANIKKDKLLNRAIKVYLFVQEKLVDIRMGNNPRQSLNEAIKVLTNMDLLTF